jgi:hypothetical protein
LNIGEVLIDWILLHDFTSLQKHKTIITTKPVYLSSPAVHFSCTDDVKIVADVDGVDGYEVVVLKRMKPPFVGLGIFIGEG